MMMKREELEEEEEEDFSRREEVIFGVLIPAGVLRLLPIAPALLLPHHCSKGGRRQMSISFAPTFK